MFGRLVSTRDDGLFEFFERKSKDLINSYIFLILEPVAHMGVKGSFNVYFGRKISRFKLYILGSDIEGKVYVIHI